MIKHKRRINRQDSDDSSIVQPSDWLDDHDVDGLLGQLLALSATPESYPYIAADGSGAQGLISAPARAMLAAATVQLIRAAIGAAAVNSPALTGVPTAPTPALGTNTDQIATMAAIKAALDNLVNAAPGSLDTLKELADAIGDDPNFAATMSAALGNRVRFDAAQSLTTLQKAQAVANLALAAVAVSGAYADLSGKPTLGTAAALDVGTIANKIVQLDGAGKIPALDGSQLTGVPVNLAVSVIKIAAGVTYTPTPGTKLAFIQGVGAGAGGSGQAGQGGNNADGAPGGGAGEYVTLWATIATLGSSQVATIGAAGAGGAAGNNAGGDGGDTSLGTLLIAKGGKGGGAGSLGRGGLGGTGGTGDTKSPGQPGANGMYAHTSGGILPFGGNGGSGPFGAGGRGAFANVSAVAGDAATGYGAGGGGAATSGVATNAAGGNGTGGYLVITEYRF